MKYGLLLLFSLFLMNSKIVYSNTIELKQVSIDWTFRGSIVSAFPRALKNLKLRENYEVKDVFHFSDPKDGKIVRVELFFTGGDAEYYPQFYIFTNARNGKTIIESSSSTRSEVYFIEAFSSPDRELGETPPRVDPFEVSSLALRKYIVNNILDHSGKIKSIFKPNCPYYMLPVLSENTTDCRKY